MSDEAFSLEGILGAFNSRLAAARYVVERLHFTAFAKSVLAGEMPEDAINGEMGRAMENFDQIMEAAAKGSYGETIEHTGRDFHAEYLKLIGNARIAAAAQDQVHG